MAILQSVADVFVALGGNRGVKQITGASDQSVSNWKMRHQIPPRHYVVMTHALEKQAMRAKPSLWGMNEAP